LEWASPRPGQGWQQNARQDADDGDDHQRFYQGETTPIHFGISFSLVLTGSPARNLLSMPWRHALKSDA
jgi:hypothetical protein